MPPKRRKPRRKQVVPATIAIVIGLASATGIYWLQNPATELKMPQSLSRPTNEQVPQRPSVPDSFQDITATETLVPPTREPPPTLPRETSDSPSILERVSQAVSESREERWARQEEENAAMVEVLERKVHDGINVERAEIIGSRLLRWDDRLNAIARAHSEDMTERGYFDHDTPEGLGPTERAEKAGYNCRKLFHYGLAENITIELMSKDIDKLAAAAVKGWMDSPGHRANLLGRQYDRTGVGASLGKWRGYQAVYLTQVFC